MTIKTLVIAIIVIYVVLLVIAWSITQINDVYDDEAAMEACTEQEEQPMSGYLFVAISISLALLGVAFYWWWKS